MDKGTKGFPQNLPFNPRRGVTCIWHHLVLVLLLKTVLLVISFRKLIFNNKKMHETDVKCAKWCKLKFRAFIIRGWVVILQPSFTKPSFYLLSTQLSILAFLKQLKNKNSCCCTLGYDVTTFEFPSQKKERKGGWEPTFASNLKLNFGVLIRPYWSGQVHSLVKESQIDFKYKN